jgi:hypothetical protein
MGAIHPPSVGGALYCLLIRNDATGYRLAYCLSRKSNTLSCIQQAVRETLRDTGHAVQVIRTDHGGEFVNKAAAEYYDHALIRQELMVLYSLEQNGTVERGNRTVMELVHSMIYSQKTPSHFWAKATQTAVYVLNWILSCTLSCTPYESWYRKRPSFSYLCTFSCQAFIHAEKHTHTKLESKSRPGLFMGYVDESKAYRVWDLTKDKIVITRDVIFHKVSPVLSSSTMESSITPISPTPSPITVYFPQNQNAYRNPYSPVSNLPTCPSPSPLASISSPTSVQTSSPISTSSLQESHTPVSFASDFLITSPAPITPTTQIPSSPILDSSPDILNPILRTWFLADILQNSYDPSDHDPQNRLDLQLHSLPARDVPLHARYGNWAYFTALTDAAIIEPTTITEALSSPNKDKWISAMNEEYTSLQENGT